MAHLFEKNRKSNETIDDENDLIFFSPQEVFLESQIDELADICGALLERVAPDAFFNMTVFNTADNLCRVGTGPIEKWPFSGTSTVIGEWP